MNRKTPFWVAGNQPLVTILLDRFFPFQVCNIRDWPIVMGRGGGATRWKRGGE